MRIDPIQLAGTPSPAPLLRKSDSQVQTLAAEQAAVEPIDDRENTQSPHALLAFFECPCGGGIADDEKIEDFLPTVGESTDEGSADVCVHCRQQAQAHVHERSAGLAQQPSWPFSSRYSANKDNNGARSPLLSPTNFFVGASTSEHSSDSFLSHQTVANAVNATDHTHAHGQQSASPPTNSLFDSSLSPFSSAGNDIAVTPTAAAAFTSQAPVPLTAAFSSVSSNDLFTFAGDDGDAKEPPVTEDCECQDANSTDEEGLNAIPTNNIWPFLLNQQSSFDSGAEVIGAEVHPPSRSHTHILHHQRDTYDGGEEAENGDEVEVEGDGGSYIVSGASARENETAVDEAGGEPSMLIESGHWALLAAVFGNGPINIIAPRRHHDHHRYDQQIPHFEVVPPQIVGSPRHDNAYMYTNISGSPSEDHGDNEPEAEAERQEDVWFARLCDVYPDADESFLLQWFSEALRVYYTALAQTRVGG